MPPPNLVAAPGTKLSAERLSPASGSLPLLLVFALTLFVSATLLFLVQPMIGKMLLPMLGGTPAVWNTCMMFFQALLLAGYAYAHAATGGLGVRRQSLLHLGVLLLPLLTLGLTIHKGLFVGGEDNPIPGLLLALVLSVGLPFFVVSTSAPLLQKWFAETGHPQAKDPYFLYGASNLGSMLALVGYPVVIEWQLQWGLPKQRLLWQIGYGLLAGLMAVCAFLLWRTGRAAGGEEAERAPHAVHPPPPSPHPDPLTLARRLYWVALAFVPSSLMLGATTYMTTDIAAIPLLWVLPLALYLLSFILVFSRLPLLVHRVMVVLLPMVVLVLVFLMQSEWAQRRGVGGMVLVLVVHLVVLFVAAMVCHGELARDRPPTRHLTEFYLLMSVGGVLGGLSNGLVAPLIFHSIVEYPLALVVACLLLPTLEGETPTRVGPVLGTGLIGLFLGAALALLAVSLGRTDLEPAGLLGLDGFWLAVGLLAAGALVFFRKADPEDRAARRLDLGLPLALGVLAVGLNLGLRNTDLPRGLNWLYYGVFLRPLSDWLPKLVVALLDVSRDFLLAILMYGLPALLCYAFVKRPLRFGLGVAALFLAGAFCDLLDEDVRLRERSFFGALRVRDEGEYRRLEHGTTLHGMQRVRWTRAEIGSGMAGLLAAPDPLSAAALATAGQDLWLNPGREPLTYFHRTGPIGQVFTSYRDWLADKHTAIIGLGTGTLAAYGQPGQRITYFEIDPLIKRLTYDDKKYFTYIQDADRRGVVLKLVMGDARLKLEERAGQGPPDHFALLVIDAFSSDAIPIHLLTREALAIYLHNLADDGLLVFHISNRYLDLEPVLGNLAKERGLVGYIQADGDGDIPGKASSNWVVLSRKESALDRLVHAGRWEEWKEERGWDDWQDALLRYATVPDAGGRAQAHGMAVRILLDHLRAPWRPLKERPEVGVWTDDYSNLLRVFDWKN